MTEETFLEILQRELVPEPYREVIEAGTDIGRFFWQSTFRALSHVFAVIPWRENVFPRMQLGTIRHQINCMFDVTFINSIGAIVLWYGPEAAWRPALEVLSPDKTGLTGTIIQGLVFVDLETGRYEIRQSHWGPITFGNQHGRFTKLRNILDQIPTG